MIALLLTWVTLAFVVFSADSVGEEKRPGAARVARAGLWPITLTNWFTHRNLEKLGRFVAIVWFLVTTGWLLSFLYDHLPAPAFLLAAQVTMGFVVYCVDALSADLVHKRARRLVRSVVWIGPIAHYFRDKDSVGLLQASLTVWGLLTTGWLLGLIADRVAAPLAGLS